jgi:hypothetical protein
VPYQPRATLDNSYGAQVSFRTLDVLPPAAYYVGLDDQVALTLTTDYAPATFALVVRMLNPQGGITVERTTLSTIPGGPESVSTNLTGMEGYVLSACVSAPGVPLGKAYATLTLVRAPYVASGYTTAQLVAGYVSETLFLSYPSSPPQPPLAGPASLVTLNPTPAVGAQWRCVAPLSARWRVVSAQCSLQTSAAVAARAMVINVENPGGYTTALYPAPATQPASTDYVYSLNLGAAGTFLDPVMSIGASTTVLVENGGALVSNCQQMQAGDQFLGVIVEVEEWMGV